ncbi:MAG: OmpA family protein [Myxococcota bacterium]|nr:OmpA family protein [Myxococcota bacterium]
MPKPRFKIEKLGLIVAFVASLSSFGCVKGAMLAEKTTAMEDKLTASEKPAMKCAPKELATARAQLEFVRLELKQGALLRANEHMAEAERAAKYAQGMTGRPECEDDRDGDGIIDSRDQCPDQPEDFDRVEDQDGCPEDQDTDGDGINDSVDRCPNEPEDRDGVEDDDGCPDLTKDRDGDGFLDEVDGCPDKPEDKDGYQDEDGCPDTDNDKDRIPDVVDRCPDEPEDYDGDADEDGCPDIYKTIVIRDDRIELKQKVYFATDKARILSKSFDLLNEVASALKDRSSIKVRIEGHTDSVGSASYNKTLSLRRAKSVRKYLVKKGIDGSRMAAEGLGEERPIEDNRTSEGRAANRRVEFHIVSQ